MEYVRVKNKFWLMVLTMAVMFLGLPQDGKSGVNVNKKFLFLNQSMRSTPVTISNPTNTTFEVSLSAKFGYLISKDSGKADIFFDTTGTPPQSAAGWIQMFPKRFKLGPSESQVVRITATPPPNIPDGEYWARIYIAQQDVKSPLFKPEKSKSGLILIEQMGIPFHFRKGKVTTGLEITNLKAEADQNNITVTMDMQRIGNSAYWGIATYRIYNSDQPRKMILKETKLVAVYTSFSSMIVLNRKGIPSGQYSMEVEFRTEGRQDVRMADLIQDKPMRVTQEFTLH